MGCAEGTAQMVHCCWEPRGSMGGSDVVPCERRIPGNSSFVKKVLMAAAIPSAAGIMRRGALARPALSRVARLSTQPSEDPPLLPDPIPSLATATFDWKDPLRLSASLTEEELIIYGTALDFAQAELQPGIVQATSAGTFDRGII